MESRPVWNIIWKARTIQRNKMLLWRLGHNKLPTRDRVASWSNVSPLCARCGSSKETNIHMARDCLKFVEVWKAFINPKDRSLFFYLPTQEWIKWNLKREASFYGIPWDIIFPIVASLYEPHCEILQQAKLHASAWTSEVKKGVNHRSSLNLAWEKGNDKGEWLMGFMAKVGTAFVVSVELWGLFYGPKIAWEKGWRRVEVESDSMTAINHINDAQVLNHALHPIIQNIRELTLRDWEIKIKFILRVKNKYADSLAKHSLSGPMGLNSIEHPSVFLKKKLLLDMVNSCDLADPGG
ncbi:ribonuclease H [Senna tora]|uniref:Ribonuclease H n=1 Tax=Senna tora TaxID=362788 RepID=A0A834WIR7_9FABA|nr:ribonuclease H [Senna tora]